MQGIPSARLGPEFERGRLFQQAVDRGHTFQTRRATIHVWGMRMVAVVALITMAAESKAQPVIGQQPIDQVETNGG